MPNGTERQRSVPRKIVYFIQAVAIQSALETVRLLPLPVASQIGRILFRIFGPFLKADKAARRNLAKAFPDWDRQRIDRTVNEVWNNLGRGAGEFSQVDKINTMDPNGPVEVIGLEHLVAARDAGGFVVVSAHMANWEIASVVAAQNDCPMNNIYRWAENPWMDNYFRRFRSRFMNRLLPKGVAGIREGFAALKRGEPLGLLLDQKLNEGQPIPFFGRDAMTATAPIEMALRLKLPILPTRLERLGNQARFRVTVHPPMDVPDSGDGAADAIAVASRFHEMLEEWVRERPGQWFWVHRRWPD